MKQVWPVVPFIVIAWNLPELAELDPYDQQRLLQLLCLGLTASCLLVFGSARYAALRTVGRIPSTQLMLIGTGLLLGLASAANSALPKWALIEWFMLIQLIALGVAVASARESDPNRTDGILSYSITFGASAYAIALLSGYAAILSTADSVDLSQLHPHFSNPRFAGQFFSMAIPVLISFGSVFRRFRWIPLLTASILIGFALSQGTRGTWLALLSCIGVILIFRPVGYGRFLRSFLWCICLGLCIYVVTVHVLPASLGKVATTGLVRAGSLAAITDDSLRLVIWRLAAEQTATHPILGVGPMNFAATANAVGNHPHNSVLQLLAEWGIPAAVSLLVPILLFLRRITTDWTTNLPTGIHVEPVLRCGVLAAVTAGLSQSLVDGVLVVPTSQVLLAVLLGWAAGILSARWMSVPTKSNLQRRRVGPVLGLVAAISGLALLLVAGHAVFNLDNLRSHYCGRMLPRFWVEGTIGPSDFPSRSDVCSVSTDDSGPTASLFHKDWHQ